MDEFRPASVTWTTFFQVVIQSELLSANVMYHLVLKYFRIETAHVSGHGYSPLAGMTAGADCFKHGDRRAS